MYQKALVAVDGSAASFKAVEAARQLAECGSIEEITLAHVIDYPHTGIYAFGLSLENYIPPVYVEEMDRAALQIIGKAEELVGPGVKCSTVIERGSPGETIIHLVEKGQYDLVIMGHRGLSSFERLFLGSVSNKVLNIAPCTVLVVK